MKRKKTAAEKRALRQRRKKYRFVFIDGKQKRVLREQIIDGIPVDEFIRRNADPIWLVQNEMWEYLTPDKAGGEESVIQPIQERAVFEDFMKSLEDWEKEPDPPVNGIDDFEFRFNPR